MTNMKYGPQSTFLRFVLFIILFTVLAACGRRGDPVAIMPYEGTAAVTDLKALIKDSAVYLKWGLPEDKSFPREDLKGFVIFRADVPEGASVEECECPYRSVDFIVPGSKPVHLFGIDTGETFEYLDKTAITGQTYLYKIVIMDENNRMGKDSNTVLVKGIKQEQGTLSVQGETAPPAAPKGVVTVYTGESIVITWDEIRSEGIRFYRIYRSEDKKDFTAVGQSVTPVFTDKNIKPSKKYFYRVTAVGETETEGPPSKDVAVTTSQ
jgi:predicted small lipoprotein YifL